MNNILPESPFASRDDEIVVFDEPTHRGSEGFIRGEISKNKFTEVHYRILSIVNEFLYVTAKQVSDILIEEGLIESHPKTQKILEYLFQLSLLNKFSFVGTGNKVSVSYKVYNVCGLGIKLLHSRGVHLCSKYIDQAQKPHEIKRILAFNQFYIAHRYQIKNCRKHWVLSDKNTKRCVAKFPLLCNVNTHRSLFVDVVRFYHNRDSVWHEDFKNKLDRIVTVYRNMDFTPYGYDNNPVIMLMGQDDNHIDSIQLYTETYLEEHKITLKEKLFKDKKPPRFTYFKDTFFRDSHVLYDLIFKEYEER